ncbi:MAG: hypothetical protein VKK04_04060 [Synechococcales bacterium]|nr:hypothetical protein [Synechococcales bacterium]
MSSKSLKAKITLTADCVEDAILYLSERFLRLTKAGCRVVRTQGEFCLADVCQPLIAGWLEGRVQYAPGSIVLLFHSGELTPEADLLIYTPEGGDRFLYTKPHPTDISDTSAVPQSKTDATISALHLPPREELLAALKMNAQRLDQLAVQQQSLEAGLQHWTAQSVQAIAQAVAQAVNQSVTHSVTQSVAQSIAQSIAHLEPQAVLQPVDPGGNGDRPTSQLLNSLAQILELHANRTESAIAQALSLYSQQLSQQIGQQINQQIQQQLAASVDRQTETLAQRVSAQIRQQLQPLHQQIDALHHQLTDLTAEVQALDLGATDAVVLPQTPEEWRSYIHEHWGTVGDYERYSSSYREANAATPLHLPPDWIVLCELDWARELSPTLADLYRLIHGVGGIGDEGADILQQFGRHLDGDTGEPYYLYQLGGYQPYEALWQIAYNPSHSWLPELQRLWQRLAQVNHPIFQLFGWEPEAIAALQRIVRPEAAGPQSGSSQSGPSRSTDSHQSPPSPFPQGTTLQDYQAILNLGPFTPITIESIKRAYRQAMKTAHPDSGGSTELAQRVNEAYEAVMRHYFPKAT